MKYFKLSFLAIALASFTGSVFAAAPSAQQSKGSVSKPMYKWVDKEGKTHYGDTIPPEYIPLASERIEKSGRTKKIAGQKTLDEISDERREEEARRKNKEEEALRITKAKEIYYRYESREALNNEAKRRDQAFADDLASIEYQIQIIESKIKKTSENGSKIERLNLRQELGELRNRRDSIDKERSTQNSLHLKALTEWEEAATIVKNSTSKN